MADHQQTARPALQLPDQRLPVWPIQVVAGLVEDQEVRLREQRTDQRDAHGLAAAERGGGRRSVQMAEAIALQLVPQSLTHIPALAHRLEILGRATARLDARQGLQCFPHTDQIGHRGLRCRHLLSQIMHATGSHTAPGAGLQLAGQDARQDGLAHAIASDQPRRAGVELFAQIGEERSAVRQNVGNAFQRKKGTRHATSGDARNGAVQRPSCRRRHQWRMGAIPRRVNVARF